MPVCVSYQVITSGTDTVIRQNQPYIVDKRLVDKPSDDVYRCTVLCVIFLHDCCPWLIYIGRYHTPIRQSEKYDTFHCEIPLTFRISSLQTREAAQCTRVSANAATPILGATISQRSSLDNPGPDLSPLI